LRSTSASRAPVGGATGDTLLDTERQPEVVAGYGGRRDLVALGRPGHRDQCLKLPANQT
jgi:hypothetical protein